MARIRPVKEREIIRAAGPTRASRHRQAGPAGARINMYRYDEFDAQFVAERVEQFRGQVARRLSGELTEDQFKPLRLMNGLYLQLHAYMLRIAVPYGTLSSRQMRKLAHIARNYDKGFGHFTTRTNLQFNWIKLVDVPDILAELAERRDALHPDQRQLRPQCHRRPVRRRHRRKRSKTRARWPRSSANGRACIPNSSSWRASSRSRWAPPRQDRAALQWHDMAVQIVKNAEGRIGYKVMAGGGMGRTPYIAHVMSEFVEREDILAYLEAVLRVYNQDSRRDNIHKQRIKILINAIGAGGNAPPRRARVRGDQAHGHACNCRRRNWTASPPISRRPHSRRLPDAMPTRRRRFRELEEDQCPQAIARPAMPSPPSR